MWEYGRYNIEVKGNVIKTNPHGAFNLESTKEFYPHLIETIKSLDDQWCIILEEILDFQGATHDALELANQFNREINSLNKTIHRVFVIKNRFKLDLSISVVSEIERQNPRIFSTYNEAYEYINSLKSIKK